MLLVKMVEVCLPAQYNSLRPVLDEAFNFIYYIDEKIYVESSIDSRKRDLAKLVWAGGDIYHKYFLKCPYKVEEATFNMLMASGSLGHDKLATIETKTIYYFIKSQEHKSMKKLRNYIEELFADMLHFFLAQLPNVIFKEVNECSIESCEERSRTALKFLCEVDSSLEDKVQWSFPQGANITSIVDSQDHSLVNALSDQTLKQESTTGTSTQNVEENGWTSIQDVASPLAKEDHGTSTKNVGDIALEIEEIEFKLTSVFE